MRICAGGLLVRRDEILLAKRSEHRDFYPGVWDFVGGHCEERETPADALVREFREEIGVEVLAFEEIAVVEEALPALDDQVRCHMFLVTAWEGDPRILDAEHSELRWLTLDDALALPLAHPGYGDLFRAALERANVGARGARQTSKPTTGDAQ